MGLKIKVVSNFTIKDKQVEPIKFQLKIGTKVKHKEEGIIGEIKFIGSDKVAIVWEDNSRERMLIDEAKASLEYVDDIESLVSPTTTQISNNEQVNEVIDKTLAVLDSDELENSDEVSSVDIEKIKIQRKLNELESKLTVKTNNNIKEKVAKELVDLMVMKEMIQPDDTGVEIQRIAMMDDEEFQKQKDEVLDYKNESGQVDSYVENREDLSEAELALRKIKGDGGRGIIGDFSSQIPSSLPNSSNSFDGKRSLAGLKNKKITFSNQYTIPEFEDQFVSILNSEVDINRTQNKVAAKTELPGFENIQGLKMPLVPNKPLYENPTNTSMKDLFSNLNWTTMSQR